MRGNGSSGDSVAPPAQSTVHPLIQTARDIADGSLLEAGDVLTEAVERAKDLEEENARLRAILDDHWIEHEGVDWKPARG